MEKQETKILLEIEEIIKKRKTDPEQLLFMAWFFSSVGVTAEDFITVCDIADIDPDYVKSFAFKVLRSKEVDFVRKRINTVLTFS
jgi:hypothetical protein